VAHKDSARKPAGAAHRLTRQGPGARPASARQRHSQAYPARKLRPNVGHQLRGGASQPTSPEGAFASLPGRIWVPISHVSCMPLLGLAWRSITRQNRSVSRPAVDGASSLLSRQPNRAHSSVAPKDSARQPAGAALRSARQGPGARPTSARQRHSQVYPARKLRPNGPHQLRDGASDSRSPEGAFASQPS